MCERNTFRLNKETVPLSYLERRGCFMRNNDVVEYFQFQTVINISKRAWKTRTVEQKVFATGNFREFDP